MTGFKRFGIERSTDGMAFAQIGAAFVESYRKNVGLPILLSLPYSLFSTVCGSWPKMKPQVRQCVQF
ncbi:MAG TPA: hypothetical protein VM884_09225 [Flavisolibacter sp.]|nr:hypothetical protein [Flavisolibacter sp.]